MKRGKAGEEVGQGCSSRRKGSMPRCRWEQAGCVEGLEHSSMMERRPKVGGGKSGMESAFIVGS